MEWEAYLSIDPLESIKADYKFSYLASLLTNLVIRAVGKKGAKLTSVSDFNLEWDAEEAEKSRRKQQTTEQMKEILLAIASSVNSKLGKDKEEQVTNT